MAESPKETKKKLLESAKKEFLEKGYMGASLRTIAANAGVTTGAMYRHFKDKDDFFCALVDEAIDISTKAVTMASVSVHEAADNPVGKEHEMDEKQITENFLAYIYENFDAFTLLLTKSVGSTHEHFLDEICDLYTKNCLETFNWMYDHKYCTKKVDGMTVHIIASSIINSFAEIILHKIPKEDALPFIENIREFFHYGSLHMMGIPCADKH